MSRPPYHRYRAARATSLAVVAAAVLVGCASALRSIAPANLTPITAATVADWTAPFQPAVPLQFDLRWRFENREGSAAGRAVARYAPPDTLRFDYRGPFGRSGSVLVVGNEAVWSEPEGDLDNLIPVAPVLWAALGIVTAPEEEADLLGSETTDRRAWRYAHGDHAVDYIQVLQGKARLLAELRELDKILGVVDVELSDSAPTTPVSAVMRFPSQRSKFSLTVRQVDSVAPFPSETWQHP
ncbi:MAG: hypothetical protein OEY20_05560 [Gemmatimonadota bacterium]|nr:hypothetical protein [Gemmatimonadota bacterium]